MEANNKIVLVTGGSRGLGKDMALRIAMKKMDIIITYKSNKDEADETVKMIQKSGQKAVALHLDMSAFETLDAFVKKIVNTLSTHWNSRKLDFMVHNAGMGATVPFGNVTEEMFTDFLNVHFKSVYFLTQKLLSFLNDGGGIINISSGSTRMSVPGYSVYASMKGAIEIFTKYLAKELGLRGIRANVVAPGPVETDFNNAAIRNNPNMKAGLSSLSPLGRVGLADDIGGVVAFLCTEDARWINGQRIEVSGGLNG